MATFNVSAATQAPIVIGATGMDEIVQNIRTILATIAYSVPLDRAFANRGDFIDAPSPYEAQRRMSYIVDVVEKYEPRVKVSQITFEALATTDAMDGVLAPVLQFTLRDGVTL